MRSPCLLLLRIFKLHHAVDVNENEEYTGIYLWLDIRIGLSIYFSVLGRDLRLISICHVYLLIA